MIEARVAQASEIPRQAVTPARSFAEIEAVLESLERAIPPQPGEDREGADDAPAAAHEAQQLLGLAEEVLEHWVCAKGAVPTHEAREGFRLLALHHQGTRGVPSFNACRETCREIAYHYNLLTLDVGAAHDAQRLHMMRMLVRHLLLFVRGKLEVESLGDFCCASRPLRQSA